MPKKKRTKPGTPGQGKVYPTGAGASLARILDARPGRYFASVDAGLRGYKTRHLLGEVLHCQEKWVEAEVQWRAAAAERPDFLPAWLALGEMFLRQRRWDEAHGVADKLAAQESGRGPARMMRARACLGREEWAGARRALEEVIAREPQSLTPRVLLTHALLREGGDWESAERALRDVLALDPGNEEARHNLTVLLRQMGQPVQ